MFQKSDQDGRSPSWPIERSKSDQDGLGPSGPIERSKSDQDGLGPSGPIERSKSGPDGWTVSVLTHTLGMQKRLNQTASTVPASVSGGQFAADTGSSNPPPPCRLSEQHAGAAVEAAASAAQLLDDEWGHAWKWQQHGSAGPEVFECVDGDPLRLRLVDPPVDCADEQMLLKLAAAHIDDYFGPQEYTRSAYEGPAVTARVSGDGELHLSVTDRRVFFDSKLGSWVDFDVEPELRTAEQLQVGDLLDLTGTADDGRSLVLERGEVHRVECLGQDMLVVHTSLGSWSVAAGWEFPVVGGWSKAPLASTVEHPHAA